LIAQLIVLALAAALAVGGGAGYYARGVQAAADEAAALRSQVKAMQMLAANNNALATKYETARARRSVVTRTVTKEVTRVIRTPFYAAGNQCFDADGLRQLRAAIGAAPTPASGASAALRGPDAAQ